MIHIHAMGLVRLALNPKLQINPEPLDPKTFGGLSDGPSFSELPIIREYGSPKTWRTPHDEKTPFGYRPEWYGPRDMGIRV